MSPREHNKMEFGFIFRLLSNILLVSMTTGSYCNPGSSTPNPNAPPLPQMPPSFQTRLEANLAEQGYTMEVAEYADYDNNRAALTVINHGDLTLLVYDYQTNQIYQVHDGVCTTKKLSNDTLDDYLFGDMSLKGGAHIYSTNDIIKMAERFGETYIGQTEVRGIWCDHWQSCMYWDYFKANFTLDYYFTALNWTTSMIYPQVPVRADVTGIMQTTSGPRKFHHIYDYYDFRPGIEPGTTVFETPPNVVCPNRKTLKLIPKLANQFYFRSEQTDITTGNTVNMQVWYDSLYNFVRADYGLQRPAIHIDDFNRGIQYVIDKKSGTCQLQPIPVTTQAAKKVVDGNHWLLQLLSPREFLRLQENFVYVGQRNVRGIPCDVFVADANGADFPTSTSVDNVTVEAYFSRNSESETPDTGTPGDKDEYSHVLVQMMVYVNQSQFDNLISYYDFDFSHSNPMETFDLTSCYSDRDKIGFRIKLPIGAAPDLMSQQRSITQQVLKRLSVELQLEPTRIQHLHLHADENNLYVSGQLLERPTLLARYYMIPHQSIEMVDGQYNATSDAGCAAHCDLDTDCLSFSLCSDDDTDNTTSLYTCYISHVAQQYDPEFDIPLTINSCNRFTAIVKRPADLPDHDLHSAWMALRNMVYTWGLAVQLDRPNDPDKLNVMATEVIQDDIWKRDTTDFLPEVNLFNRTASLVSPTSVLHGMAFDDCARACVGDDECLAFSICLDSTICQLQTEPVTTSSIKPSNLCFVYDAAGSSSSPAASKDTFTGIITTMNSGYTNMRTTETAPFTTGGGTTETGGGTTETAPFTTRGVTTTVPFTTAKVPAFILYKKNADFMSLAHTKIARSVEECMEYCILDEQCKTFTICARDKKCHLSYVQPDNAHANLTKQHFGCDVYTLSAGMSVSPPFFTTTGQTPSSPIPSASHSPSPSPVSPGCPSVSPSTGNQVLGYFLVASSTLAGVAKSAKPLVPNASQCGETCSGRTDFKCKSFQYCPGNKMCNMFDSRHLPVPRALKVVTTCQFYTRQFLADFVKQTSSPTGSQQFTPVKDLALHECADVCGQDSTSCASFQYCPTTEDCLIETTKQAISFSSQTQKNCQYYKGSLTHSASDQLGSTTNIGMIAGIAVATLVLGIIVGALVIYLVNRRQRKNYDFDMHTLH